MFLLSNASAGQRLPKTADLIYLKAKLFAMAHSKSVTRDFSDSGIYTLKNEKLAAECRGGVRASKWDDAVGFARSSRLWKGTRRAMLDRALRAGSVT